MKYAFYVLALLLAVSLQTGFFGYVRPFGVMPNLLLVMVLMQGLFGSASATVALAVGGGLLLDMASGDDFGLRMAFYAFLSLAVIAIRQFGLHLDALWVTAVIAVLATVCFDLAVLSTVGFSGMGGQIGGVTRKVAIEAMQNTALALIAQLAIMMVGGTATKMQVHKKQTWL